MDTLKTVIGLLMIHSDWLKSHSQTYSSSLFNHTNWSTVETSDKWSMYNIQIMVPTSSITLELKEMAGDLYCQIISQSFLPVLRILIYASIVISICIEKVRSQLQKQPKTFL